MAFEDSNKVDDYSLDKSETLIDSQTGSMFNTDIESDPI